MQRISIKLLNSAKSRLTEPSDQSAAKKLMMAIKMEGAHAEFSLDQFCVQMITTATFITCSS